MKTQTLSIEGPNICSLQNHILETIRPRKYYRDNDLFVYMFEQYFFRVKSNLMSVLIIKFVNDSRCNIEITTGGGSDEIDNDWGAENKANQGIIKDLVGISIANSWNVIGIDIQKYSQPTIADRVGKFFDRIRDNE